MPRKKQQNGAKNGEDTVMEDFRIAIKKQIEEFLQNDRGTQYKFPSSLTKKERSYIHEHVQKLGLNSKSEGPADNRCLILYKKVKNVSACRKILILKNESRQHLQNLLASKDFELREDTEHVEIVNVKKSSGFMSGRYCVPPNTKSIPKLIKKEKCELPMYKYRDEFLKLLQKNSVIIVNGETGSGKTTQIPQYILEQCCTQKKPCRIICTQPRRIAAVSVSQRVAEERGEVIGKTVGYQIRLEGCVSPNSNLIYTTSGCILRTLMSNKNEAFQQITHLIIDEIHERDKNTDFLLISLKDQLIKNPGKLKVILMSATMDIDHLRRYFFDCPVINVPGQGYDVKTFYLADILFHANYKTKQMELVHKHMKQAEGQPGVTQTEIKPEAWIDKSTHEMVDSSIQDCIKNVDESDNHLAQLLYFVEGEGVPVDVCHTVTKKTPLMAAAIVRSEHWVKKFLNLGADADVEDADGMTARNYAGDALAHLFGPQSASASNKRNDALIDEQNLLLRAYQATFNDDEDVDHKLIVSLIKKMCENGIKGAIMVFLPGYNDILQQKEYIEDTLDPGTFQLFILHGNMNTANQQQAFKPIKERKIILSTNIGQTSITIPDLVFVIDTGKVKMKTYDSITNSSLLRSVWISKAAANQRAGRAGRRQNGICYRLFSEQKYEAMPKFCIPEFLRIPLTEICLYAKTLDGESSIEDYLSKALDPPSAVSVANAVLTLKLLEVFDDNENVTVLGKHLVNMPFDVQLGKALLYSILFQCVEPVLTIVAYHSVKDPFILPLDRSEQNAALKQRKAFAETTFSDQMGILNMFEEYKGVRRNSRALHEFCRKNYLSVSSLDLLYQTKSQIYQQIRGIYNLREDSNRNSVNLIKMCLVAGLYPNVVMADYNERKFLSKIEKKVIMHQQSILRDGNGRNGFLPPGTDDLHWVVYHEKSRFGNIAMANQNTMVPSIMIALMCGKGIDNDIVSDWWNYNPNTPVILHVDDWINFTTNLGDKVIITQLRKCIRQFFWNFLRTGYNSQTDYSTQAISWGLDTILSYELRRHVVQDNFSNCQSWAQFSLQNQQYFAQRYSPYYGSEMEQTSNRSNPLKDIRESINATPPVSNPRKFVNLNLV